MYSPKIREDLIPDIYRLARAVGLKMTTLVNEILEKVLTELSDLQRREGISRDNALLFQTGLEKTLNGLQKEIRSSLIDERKEATLVGEFRISINRKSKLKCDFITKKERSIQYPVIEKDRKEATHETARANDRVGKAKATEMGPEDRLIEIDNDAGGSDAEISDERQQLCHHPALPQPNCGEA